MQAQASYAGPKRSGGTMFYVFSALVHIGAVVLLSRTWAVGAVSANAQIEAAAEATEPAPAVARLPIDIAPVKYCELKIEELAAKSQQPVVR